MSSGHGANTDSGFHQWHVLRAARGPPAVPGWTPVALEVLRYTAPSSHRFPGRGADQRDGHPGAVLRGHVPGPQEAAAHSLGSTGSPSVSGWSRSVLGTHPRVELNRETLTSCPALEDAPGEALPLSTHAQQVPLDQELPTPTPSGSSGSLPQALGWTEPLPGQGPPGELPGLHRDRACLLRGRAWPCGLVHGFRAGGANCARCCSWGIKSHRSQPHHSFTFLAALERQWPSSDRDPTAHEAESIPHLVVCSFCENTVTWCLLGTGDGPLFIPGNPQAMPSTPHLQAGS